MKVIATAAGYHGKVRQAGEQFDVPQGTKGSWFVPVEEPAKPAGKPAGKQGTKGDDLV